MDQASVRLREQLGETIQRPLRSSAGGAEKHLEERGRSAF
jgi:hypothetical protein